MHSVLGGALLSFMGVSHVELVTFVAGNRSLCLGGDSPKEVIIPAIIHGTQTQRSNLSPACDVFEADITLLTNQLLTSRPYLSVSKYK